MRLLLRSIARLRSKPQMKRPDAPFTIRLAQQSDAFDLAAFFPLLGHPMSPTSIVERWLQWESAGSSAWVAEDFDGNLLGVITTHQMIVLHRDFAVGRITSLLVAPTARGMGIGRALVGNAERELMGSGCTLIEVTSNFRFEQAHSFYEHLGYEKTSVRLAKKVEPSV